MDESISFTRRIIPATETAFLVPSVPLIPLAGASIDLWYSTGQYYDSSLGTPLSAVVTNYISCSRASTGYAKTSTGSLTNFSTNVLRITDLGLLIEDTATNLCLQSEDLTTTWTTTNSSITANTATAPNGAATADAIVESASAGGHYVSQSITLAASSVYNYSVFAKQNSRRYVALVTGDGTNRYSVVFDLQTGTITTTNTVGSPLPQTNRIETYTNGWYRCSVSVQLTGTSGSFSLQLSNSATPTFDGSGNVTYTGDGASNAYYWGAHVEIGSTNSTIISSYIPTTTASVARALDSVTCIGGLSTLLTTLPQSAVFDMTSLISTITASMRMMGDTTSANTQMYQSASDTVVAMYNGTVLSATIGNSLGFSLGVKTGFAQDGSGRAVVGGGGTVGTDAVAGTASTAPQLGAFNAANVAAGYYRRTTFWSSKLANGILQGFSYP